MALGLRKIREIVQALLRVWNKKDEGNVLENAAQTSTASGDGAAGQSPGTPSRPANIQTIHGRPLNAAGLRAVERTTQLVFGGPGTHQRPENTKKVLSDPGVHIDMAKKAPHQERQLPEIRCKRSSEVNWQGWPEQVRWQMSPRKPRKAGRSSGCEKVDTGFRKNPAPRIESRR